MKTTLLIMTLNEIDGMKTIIPRIDRAWVDQILVIDGGSTDGTVEWARENDYQVHQQKQTGIRMGYKEAWHLIEGDVVMTFSPDGNSIPEKIPEVFAKMREGSDMVVAARVKRTPWISKSRRPASRSTMLRPMNPVAPQTRTFRLLTGDFRSDRVLTGQQFRRRPGDELAQELAIDRGPPAKDLELALAADAHRFGCRNFAHGVSILVGPDR